MDMNILLPVGIVGVVLVIAVFILRKKKRVSASLSGPGVKLEITADSEGSAPDGRESARTSSTSSRNVSIGGSADDATIVTGDKNQVR